MRYSFQIYEEGSTEKIVSDIGGGGVTNKMFI